MSLVIAAPEVLTAAAADLAKIDSAISVANAVALAPTSGVLAAAGDEVSAAIAEVFGAHGQAYQAVSAQTATFHNQFVQLVGGAAGQYALAEAANVSPLQTLQQDILGAINTPTQLLLGHPLIGNGANATVAGGSGGDGGLLFGNGGNGAAGGF